MLEAPEGTEALVLEMAMRGEGQIAELVGVAEPDCGVIVNVGPVHLELLGTVERVAAAKAELIRDLPAGATCVVPGRRAATAMRTCATTSTRSPSARAARCSCSSFDRRGDGGIAEIEARGEILRAGAGLLRAATTCSTRSPAWPRPRPSACGPRAGCEAKFSSLRGAIVELAGGVTVVNDCYNANPMSMRAALQHLAETPADRRLAVLGTMAELGEGSEAFHRDIGEEAAALGIDVLMTVGEQALPYAERLRGRVLRGGHSGGGRRAAGGDRPARRPRAGEGLAVRGA